MSDKYLFKIVSQYCDKTVPSQIIVQSMDEAKELHAEGKLTFSEECIYDWMRGIKKDKHGVTVSVMGRKIEPSTEATEPEDWELINEGMGETRDEYEEELL